MKKVGYDPLKSLEPVAVLARAPNLIVVNPSVPVKTPRNSWPGPRRSPTYPSGTAGAAGSTHLGGEWLRKATGYQFNHVPYKGLRRRPTTPWRADPDGRAGLDERLGLHHLGAPASHRQHGGRAQPAVPRAAHAARGGARVQGLRRLHLAGPVCAGRHAGVGAHAAQWADQQDHARARDGRAPASAVQRAAGRDGSGADTRLRRRRSGQVAARRFETGVKSEE